MSIGLSEMVAAARAAEPPRPGFRTRGPGAAASAAGFGAAQRDGRAGELRQRIVRVLAERGPVSADGAQGGATACELVALLHGAGRATKEGSIRARLSELARSGLVRLSGLHRPGDAGVPVGIYEVPAARLPVPAAPPGRCPDCGRAAEPGPLFRECARPCGAACRCRPARPEPAAGMLAPPF